MAATTVLTGLELTKWRRSFVREFIRDSGFEPYMGDAATNIIHVHNDLKSDGYKLRVPLVKRLQQAGVTGSTTLSGTEEALDQYYFEIEWDFHRHAMMIDKKERAKSAPDLLATFRPHLREWSSELIKYQIIDQFHTIDGVKYTDATEVEKDAWLTANETRVLFGSAVGNNAINDHSAALAAIDTTNDKLSANMITLMKRRARFASPHIKPFKTGTQGREYYVLFAHPLCFRDLKQDETMLKANREARPRDVDKNPIFQDGDLIYDGVIIREIPEFYQPRFDTDTVNTQTHLAGVGDSGSDVGVNFLCGTQAICYANKQFAMPTTDRNDDYGFLRKLGIEMAHGIGKMRWSNGASDPSVDFGVSTIYASAQADA